MRLIRNSTNNSSAFYEVSTISNFTLRKSKAQTRYISTLRVGLNVASANLLSFAVFVVSRQLVARKFKIFSLEP